jgi:hypothetical protein
MATVQVRLSGGGLHGQVVWVEEGCASLTVNLAAPGGGKRTLQYRRDGAMLKFAGETPEPSADPAGG